MITGSFNNLFNLHHHMNVSLDEDIRKRISIFAGEAFLKAQGYEYTNLYEQADRIKKSLHWIEKQYDMYPYLSRDWYVENSSEKKLHFCRKYKDLKNLVEFLMLYPGEFDFLINSEKLTLCKVVSDKGEARTEGVNAAGKYGYDVMFLRVDIPEKFEVETVEVNV